MKILVLTTRVPFIHGGAEELRDHLVANLIQSGCDAEAMSLPFSWDPAERLVDEMLIAQAIDIANVDRVIALKFPAYLTEHPNKVIWLVHQYRQAYDLWDAGKSNIPACPVGDALRVAIRAGDERAFASAKQIFTVSPVVSNRLRHYHGREAPSLAAPLNDPQLFSGGPTEGYLFAGGRVGEAKRQELLVRALVYAPGVRLVIAGPPDTPGEGWSLANLAADLNVADRLVLDLRFLPRVELAKLVNCASAAIYIPFEEDSVGYVTMEAFQASKPVLTTSDSGGVLEIVRDGETGLVVEPSPEALGAAMSQLHGTPAQTASMGRAGNRALQLRELTWPATIEKLIS